MIEELDKINAALNAIEYKTLVQGEPLAVIELYPSNMDLFTPKSQEALSKKAYHQIYQDDSGTYVSFYLSVKIKTKNVLEGLKAIADDINALSEKDLIHSALAKPSSIAIARLPLNDDISAVFCFVLINVDKTKEAESLVKYNAKEGSLEHSIGSLEQELPEGEFLSCIHISHHASIVLGSKYSIDDRVQECLNVLPKGTELVSITECAITGLSKPYEVRFRNPILISIKEVKLEHVRVYDAIDDKLVELNLLTGIKYIKRDGTTL